MSEKFKVLVADSIAPKGVELLKNCQFLSVDEKIKLTPDQLVKEVAPYHAIIIRSATKVTRAVIEAGKNLKFIGRAGVGLDNVDQDAANERQIVVKNTPACTTVSVAELALGSMLSLARMIPQADVSMKTGVWDKKTFMGIELLGKTLGLIGIGRIASAVAERSHVFGMTILSSDPFVKTSPLPYVSLVSLPELLSKSDFVSLHIPFDKKAGPTLGEEQFKMMKKRSYLINCARGGTVDEKALLAALKNETLAGAAIDVWEKEPTENKELVDHPRVIALPHIGASAKEGQARAGIEVAELAIAEFKPK